MVPPFPCEFSCVQQPAVDFVGEDHREEKVAAVAAFGLRDRKTGRDVVARVPRLPAEIKVVKVEITYGGALAKVARSGVVRRFVPITVDTPPGTASATSLQARTAS